MRKRLAAAVVAGTVGIAGLTGLALSGSALSAAADTTTPSATATDGTAAAPADRATAIKDRIVKALSGLVDDGTITSDQAQKVADTLAAQAPGDGPGDGRGDGPGHGGPGGGFGARIDIDGTVATALGITADEVDTALHSGTTIADLAKQKGVDSATVVSALVDAAKKQLADAVTAGTIDQAKSDEIAATLEQRFTDLVAGTGGPGMGGHGDMGGPGGMGGPGMGGHGRGNDNDNDGDGADGTTPGTTTPSPGATTQQSGFTA